MLLQKYNGFLLISAMLFISGAWLWRYKIKPYFVYRAMKRKLLKDPKWQFLVSTERFLLDLFHGKNPTHISTRERKRLGFDQDEFVYGEIEFLPFYHILEKVTPKETDIFYDLGSGAGKAVFAAASFFKIAKACGIELLPGLYDFANHQIKKAQNQKLSLIEFRKENFLHSDFSDGDIIFVNATCLNILSWEKLLTKFEHLKKGARIIVTSKKIQHEQFALLDSGFELMSWGVNSVNFYIKIA